MNRSLALAGIGVVLAIALTLRPGAGVHAQSAPERKDDRQITFNRDIASIIFRSCARCHRPGESGPFSLLTYDDVRKHARQIEVVTRTRFMPPWLPEPQVLKFAEEWRISDAQIAIIEQWVKEESRTGHARRTGNGSTRTVDLAAEGIGGRARLITGTISVSAQTRASRDRSLV
jgi:hypothetical protein